ncbi:hypothetical protein Golomagni_05147 [Golovinomyces magnicellulatus]|nr:hypothetical protein Golomagni_05147 [Golovinomyces magnicellulatus]
MKTVIQESSSDAMPELLAALKTLCCPISRPSKHAKSHWYLKATELLAECRRSRRQALSSKEEHEK